MCYNSLLIHQRHFFYILSLYKEQKTQIANSFQNFYDLFYYFSKNFLEKRVYILSSFETQDRKIPSCPFNFFFYIQNAKPKMFEQKIKKNAKPAKIFNTKKQVHGRQPSFGIYPSLYPTSVSKTLPLTYMKYPITGDTATPITLQPSMTHDCLEDLEPFSWPPALPRQFQSMPVPLEIDMYIIAWYLLYGMTWHHMSWIVVFTL